MQTHHTRTQTSPTQHNRQSQPSHPMVPVLMVVISTLGLIIIGLVMVYSSSSITAFVEQGDAMGEAIKQFVFALVGIAAAVAIVKFVDESKLFGTLTVIFWIICFVLLVITVFAGTVGLGAKRWLIVGGIGIQPSEFAKIAIVLMMARTIMRYIDGELDQNRALLIFAGTVLAPIAIILIFQSDLGSTVICGISVLVALWLAGVDKRVLLILVGVCVLMGIIFIIAFPYRAARLTSFMDPWSDMQEGGYQLIHSFKALAAGGFFGVGIGDSLEKMQYLPEAETDFIFAIVGEEMGLFGTLLVLALFLIFLRGSFLIAQQCQSRFGTLVVGALAAMLVFQAMLNMFCVAGLAPITGKPLPFVSSGGSSMISSCMIAGIIVSIALSLQRDSRSRQRRDNLQVVSAYPRTNQKPQEFKTYTPSRANRNESSMGYGRISVASKHTSRPSKQSSYSDGRGTWRR